MVCTPVDLGGGMRAIVCSRNQRRKKCSVCGKMRADRECDWKVTSRKSGTCDKQLCADCTFEQVRDKDLCPDHRVAFNQWTLTRKPARGG